MANLNTTCMEDKYRIERCIFRGKMSSIHLAQLSNIRGDPSVVIKKSIRKDRIFNEIEYYKKLHGAKRVLKIFDVCKGREGYSLVLELCICDFAIYLSWPEGMVYHFERLNYAMQLLEGLSEIHARNIVHRDLKPENIFITFDGILKIGDLESACDVKTQPRSAIRTLGYTPLEVNLGVSYADKSVDLWAAGCILFEIFTGGMLFPDTTLENEVFNTTQLFGLASGPFYESLPQYKEYHDTYKNVFKENHLPEHLKVFMGPTTYYEQQAVMSLLQLEPSARTPAAQLLISNPLFTNDPPPTMISMTEAVKRLMKVTKTKKPHSDLPPEIQWPDNIQPSQASRFRSRYSCRLA